MRSPVIILSALVVVCMSYAEAASVCVDTNNLTGPSHTSLYSNNNNRLNTNKRNMMDVLREDRRFARLVKVIGQAGSNLKNDLEQGNREKTLLAPTNDAFDAMEQTLNVRVENMNRNDLSELLMYHMIPKRAVNKNNLCNGDLLETALTQKGLGGHRQMIRVGRHGQRVRLNMYSQIVESNIETENGVIQAISEVMHVPRPMFEMMTSFPSMFSTHALALTLTGMDKKVDTHTKMTALMVTNEAWESIGVAELMELFQPENREELKTLMMKHIVPEMIYVQLLAMQKGMSENQCARQQRQNSFNNNNDNENRMVVQKSLPTMMDEQVTLRVVCRGGELRSIIDETTVTLQDIPTENGVMQLLAQPLCLNKSNRRHRRQPNRMNESLNNRRRRSPRNFSTVFDQDMFSFYNNNEIDNESNYFNRNSRNNRDRRNPNMPDDDSDDNNRRRRRRDGRDGRNRRNNPDSDWSNEEFDFESNNGRRGGRNDRNRGRNGRNGRDNEDDFESERRNRNDRNRDRNGRRNSGFFSNVFPYFM